MKIKSLFLQAFTLLLLPCISQPAQGTTAITDENVIDYDIEIAGVPVTSQNCNDLTSIPGVDVVSGHLSYDPETNTLLIDRADIAGGKYPAISNSNPGLTIKVGKGRSFGYNMLTSTESAVLEILEETTIKGDPQLWTLQNDGGLYLDGHTAVALSSQDAELVIDDALVYAKGSYNGILGHYYMMGPDDADIAGTLRITGVSSVSVYTPYYCIANLAFLSLMGHNTIISPRNAYFHTETNGYFPLWSGLCVNEDLVKDETVYMAYYNPADVNLDEEVNISDVVAVINTMAGDYTFWNTADVNSDNEVNISDVVMVINVIAGGEVPLPEPKDAATEAGYCPDTNHPHVIDLGSAGKWSCCNVGASAPWKYGEYYAWGETKEKSTYSWTTYQHCDGTEETCHNLGTDIAGTQYDVAHVKWGGDWQMPNYDQAYNLNQLSGESTTLNNVNGRKYTASNGNSIFVPSAGLKDGTGQRDQTSSGYYWSSTPNESYSVKGFWHYYSSNSGGCGSVSRRQLGLPVRPVVKGSTQPQDAASEAGYCPDALHPHVIDMGSAGKWSCCNVGASAPWEYGGYYAWGETEEKSDYSWTSYKYCDGTEETCHNLGSDIAGTQYDVAHVKWGGTWRLPSYDQQILLDNYSSEWTELNGINGRKFTATNGSTIFLPAAGCRSGDGTYAVGSCGYYWSSTLYPDNSRYAHFIFFSSSSTLIGNTDRKDGQSVRPVAE